MSEPSSKTRFAAASTPSTRAWVGLMRASRRIADSIEAELKAAGLPSLDWYDVLWELERADGSGLRQFELQPRLLLAQYNVSRLLARMEKAELVECADCKEDGRARVVSLTKAGRAMRKRMWVVYGRAIESHFGTSLADGELHVLAEILGKLGD